MTASTFHSAGDPSPACVSVIMPARNAAATITASLVSVLACPEVAEVIVIDDGSSDGTANTAQSLNDARVIVRPGLAQGIAAALNAGFATARYDFIARCDADDLFEPDRFTWQLEVLRHNSELVAVSAGFQSMTSQGKALALLGCEGSMRDITTDLLSGRSISSFCTWLTRSEALWRCGGARSWFVTAEDLDLMFRLAQLGQIRHVPRSVYHYRLHDASIVHSQPNETRQFYESAATAFAKQRASTGSDALERGTPPAPPAVTVNSAPTSAREQATGQLSGLAWIQYAAGDAKQARRTIRRAIALYPLSLSLWKHAVLLHMR